jgi:DNA recombination protein RmuC
MQIQDIIIILAIVVGFILIYRELSRKITEIIDKQKPSDELLEIVRMLQAGSKEDRKVLLESLQRNSHSLNTRLDSAAKVIGDVQKQIGEMSEIGRSMKDLQDFLRSPKLRGNIGEHILTELLGQMLPKQAFLLQHTFKSGDKVDAAIKTTAGIIPVDSKFPMENFRKMNGEGNEEEKRLFSKSFEKDVRSHIQAISKKYILTDEGTLDYALMYIPSEAIYYEVVNNADLFDYASKMRVLPVSPTTFYAYLRAILMSFEGQKIEAKAREILIALRSIQKDYSKVDDSLSTLQKHINNANNMMGSVSSVFSQLGRKINSTQSLGEDVKEEVKKISN